MKVLVVHEHYRGSSPSGEDRIFEQECRLLSDAGVKVITHEIYNDEIDASSLARRIRLGLRTIWSRESARTIDKILFAEHPDIAYFHNTFPLLSPSVYEPCNRAGVPVVQMVQSYRLLCPAGTLFRAGRTCTSCLDANLAHSVLHACYRGSRPATAAIAGMLAVHRRKGTYRDAVDAYVTPTPFVREKLMQGGVPGGKIAVRPNFLSSDAPVGRGDGGYALYFGRLSHEKGLMELVANWRYVSDLPLHIVGSGPLEDEISEYIARHAVNARLCGRARMEQLYEIIGGALFSLVPSKWYEGYPMAIVESFACGTPVLIGANANLNQIGRPGETGDHCRPEDPTDFLEKIVDLRETAPGMRAATRRYFLEHHSADTARDSLFEIFERARAGRRLTSAV